MSKWRLQIVFCRNYEERIPRSLSFSHVNSVVILVLIRTMELAFKVKIIEEQVGETFHPGST